ncbi:hypothetical protein D9615_000147 [Tricholomella constricta]|uniref:Uncharacterized protein n=1 Tax=Tricholomella constricta TaxID=117010 RepID=A0A8H5HRH5_9AGAR|nr:hypothetical protein D9615_000147 [Tricholomella constricta]
MPYYPSSTILPLHYDHKGESFDRNRPYVAANIVSRPPPMVSDHSRKGWIDARPTSRPPLKEARTVASTTVYGVDSGIWTFNQRGTAASKVGLCSVLAPPAALVIPSAYHPMGSTLNAGAATLPRDKPGVSMAFHPFSPKDLAVPSTQPRPQRKSILSQRSIMIIKPIAALPNGGRKLVFAVTNPAPHSPAMRHGKRPRTPFQNTSAVSPTQTTSAAIDKGARKRMRSSTSSVLLEEPKYFTVLDQEFDGKNKFLPFAKWLTTYISSLLGVQTGIGQPLLGDSEIDHAAERFLEVLLGYYPIKYDWDDGNDVMPTVVFLATWFLARLFPRGLLRTRDLANLKSIEVMVRTFLLGLTFANKWLDDFSHPNNSWTPFCTLALSSINSAERTALRILDYNVGITNGEWMAWLVTLAPTTSNFKSGGQGQVTAARALNDAIQKGELIGQHISLKRSEEIAPPHLLDELRERLLEGT